MRKVGDGVVHGGTFTGHSVSLAAAHKTLEILDETDALAAIRNYGLEMQKGMSRILDERGIVHSFTGAPALMGLFFASEPPQDYRGWLASDYAFYDTLAAELIEKAINRSLLPVELRLDYSAYQGKISIIEDLVGTSGWLEISKLTIDALNTDEYLVFVGRTDSGRDLDQEKRGPQEEHVAVVWRQTARTQSTEPQHEHRGDGQRQDQGRHGQEDVGDAHNGRVYPRTLVVARYQPQQHPDRHHQRQHLAVAKVHVPVVWPNDRQSSHAESER